MVSMFTLQEKEITSKSLNRGFDVIVQSVMEKFVQEQVADVQHQQEAQLLVASCCAANKCVKTRDILLRLSDVHSIRYGRT
ncbi:hypothetical protein V6N13_035533 [Hibiscus sabdariffa]|uniref:Uncharacterized protein n=1 Tax=Hibiscus sabdariffa TaxID=183260 RepID=A0ABR2S9B7_9ROSI